ncbi:hypothetical protein [Aquibium sp. ELW1220]|uniref:hypothetical protein n=1 Tax=Aquibium sp. ELW1220 TaxID=2976766 RepID=UPI0025B253B4|nr:hypothetical protein [Aquibium sp. ELW1220]MDN2581421.1 hypothetical protein [Aquibium sp. ELW1220]
MGRFLFGSTGPGVARRSNDLARGLHGFPEGDDGLIVVRSQASRLKFSKSAFQDDKRTDGFLRRAASVRAEKLGFEIGEAQELESLT